jgi:hypothetical protein
VYSAAKENLQAKLKSETLKCEFCMCFHLSDIATTTTNTVTRLSGDRALEWRVDYVVASNANKVAARVLRAGASLTASLIRRLVHLLLN